KVIRPRRDSAGASDDPREKSGAFLQYAHIEALALDAGARVLDHNDTHQTCRIIFGVDARHELAQQRRVGRLECDEELAAVGVARDQPLHEASARLAAPDHPERDVAVAIPIELAARALLAQKPREAEQA